MRDALRARGWQVAGLDLRADPDDPEVIACDITDADGRARARSPRRSSASAALDVLVNNAGIGGPASAGEPPGDHVRKMLDVNVLGAWDVTAAAIDALVASRGRVVLLGSRMAFLGLPLGAAYGVSKRALVAYADALRAEYGTHVDGDLRAPGVRAHADPRADARRRACNLEGFSREEPIEQVVATIVDACTTGKPRRDVAVTRGGRVQLAVARHLPGVVDRVVARTLAKRVAAGELDGADIAAGLRERHGR